MIKAKDLYFSYDKDKSFITKLNVEIEKGKINPSYLILRALARVLHISLDTLINPDISLDDERATQMKLLYSNCPSEMKESLLHHTQETAKELAELSRKLESF